MAWMRGMLSSSSATTRAASPASTCANSWWASPRYFACSASTLSDTARSDGDPAARIWCRSDTSPAAVAVELGAYRGVSCDLVAAFERFLVRDGEPRPMNSELLPGGRGGLARRVARPDDAPHGEAREEDQHERQAAQRKASGEPAGGL